MIPLPGKNQECPIPHEFGTQRFVPVYACSNGKSLWNFSDCFEKKGCDIGQVIVNTNDEMSSIDGSNVSISDNNKVPLNGNDMDYNSEYVLRSKRHTAKISVKHNLNDSVVSENKYDNLSVDDNEVEQGVIILIKRPPPIILKRTEHLIQDLKKINVKWGPVESKLSGPYIQMFTQSDEANHSLTIFLRTNDMGYFIIYPDPSAPSKL
ncbi:hypothetical protein AVEN_209452-1 [Araneus ventricosus]|uniref:Uncharacterized protein n=1 Tax=Araneus ventricosus TaxID=182803 RepID=A0A4Y2M1H8_ARAVE|nr:hypothetical protein AVEN_209452-1 [Araneus ventricosus]